MRTLTTSQIFERLQAFNPRYVRDWTDWLRVSAFCDFQAPFITLETAQEFKRILGKWQACRPKALRGAEQLRRTLASAAEPLTLMGSANLRCFQAPTQPLKDAICGLWRVFEDGLCVDGKATEVGITKAILLVTEGRIGPAFDSSVKMKLNAHYVSGPSTYLRALAEVAGELAAFETRERQAIEDIALKDGRPADVGRVVDMVPGPR